MKPYLEFFPNDSKQIRQKIGRRNYQAFLDTEEWEDDVIACLAHYFPNKAPFACFACGNPKKNGHLDVHHLKYARHPDRIDPTSDLVPICGACHDRVKISPSEFGLRDPGLAPEEFRRRMLVAYSSRNVEKDFRRTTRIEAKEAERRAAVRRLEAEADVDYLLEQVGPKKTYIPPPPGRSRPSAGQLHWRERYILPRVAEFQHWMDENWRRLNRESCEEFLEHVLKKGHWTRPSFR